MVFILTLLLAFTLLFNAFLLLSLLCLLLDLWLLMLQVVLYVTGRFVSTWKCGLLWVSWRANRVCESYQVVSLVHRRDLARARGHLDVKWCLVLKWHNVVSVRTWTSHMLLDQKFSWFGWIESGISLVMVSCHFVPLGWRLASAISCDESLSRARRLRCVMRSRWAVGVSGGLRNDCVALLLS